MESRMMLEGVFRDGSTDVALNDIVVSRKGVLRVIHFRLFVNGELLNSFRGGRKYFIYTYRVYRL